MKKKLIICGSLFIAFSVLFFHGCNGCTKKEENIIRIGVILPLTGEVATYGKSVQNGLDIAIEHEKSKNFKLIYEDSKAEKRIAINALEKLFFNNVKYFIGDATSTVTYEIGPRIQAKNGILIVPIATGDRIKEIGKNIFMISPRNEKQTHKIADFIKKQFSSKKVGCIFKQNDYGVNITNTFLKLFDNNVYSQAYQEGQNNFRSLLFKFKSENIALIFLPGNYEETATILRQAMEIDYRPVFIGTDGTYSPKLIELSGKASEGFLLTMMPVDYQSKIYLEFEKMYLQKYNTKPDIFACYGYESGIIMTEAINSSSNKNIEEVREYLQLKEFNSLTGMMRFISESNPNRPSWEANRDYKIYIVKNGNFIPYFLDI
ncbi:MAG TPA: ABC transporter substrate-binding protein [Candidatus Kapabacteria bacterium]|nr:ABC transporter substrate-binding protein [Candidatus Kapabacteria bacterium]